MTTVAISQPTYLPWSGYFRLMKEADFFVFLDSVQFESRSWQSRNRIKSVKPIWLTVPVHRKQRIRIMDVKIDNSKPWRRKHWNAIRTSYGKAPYFSLHSSFFKSVYEKDWEKLSILNTYIIKYLSTQLNLSPVFLQSSTLKLKRKRTQLLLEICKLLKADRYVSSIGAMEYMKKDNAKVLFKNDHIQLEFLEYNNPEYKQLFGDFIPQLSVVDCLFNCGPKSSKILFGEESASFETIT